jgi:catechol 2,3-dioxygenase-like lactoylglutathione lyase family enzyme
MARIRHIAIQTQDEEATKDFYVGNFGLEVVQRLQNERISGYFLTDGHINVAVLNVKSDTLAGIERGQGIERHSSHRLSGGEPRGNGRETAKDRGEAA